MDLYMAVRNRYRSQRDSASRRARTFEECLYAEHATLQVGVSREVLMFPYSCPSRCSGRREHAWTRSGREFIAFSSEHHLTEVALVSVRGSLSRYIDDALTYYCQGGNEIVGLLIDQ